MQNTRVLDLIRQTVPDDGQHIWGLANLSGLLHPRYNGFKYGIAVGKRLDDGIMDSVAGGPNPAYLELYNETNRHLTGVVAGLGAGLSLLGVSNLPINPTSHLADPGQYIAPLRHTFSHKMAGTRAGLGWIGKSDLFISEAFGPRLRLATVLVDYLPEPLPAPVRESKCGACVLCVKACPAGALSGKLWNTAVDRDEFFDAFKCRDKCDELCLAATGVHQTICGICISVCPVGRKRP